MNYLAGLVVVILITTTCSVDLNDLQTKLSLHTTTPTTHVAGLHSSLLLEFSVRNPTTQTVSFLKYSTPFEGIRDDIFAVVRERDSVPASYVGMKEKKREPTASDFITLDAGETKTIEVDLLKGYRFEADGHYIVHFNGAYLTASRPQPLPQQTFFILPGSNVVSLWVNNTELQPPHQFPKLADPKCSAQQDKDVAAAIPIAVQEVNQGVQFLLKKECKKPYIEWFGKKDDDRWNNATKSYTRILELLRSGKVLHGCDPKECGSSTYAFVYPGDKTHTIYLCSLFWAAPPGLHQMESKPGVLVHEASHFSDVAKTSDIAYGAQPCRDLAKKNPDNAVKNADNYEYFVESNPVC
jgi:peptidyl-Lys metalloendopeptidase